MSITAQDVNKLRSITGAGMMDCKKALTESEGDFDKAIEVLRKKGQKVSESRQDRDAKEGAVFAMVSGDGKTGVMLELNCETDFVALNDDFKKLGSDVLKQALAAAPKTLDELLAMPLEGRSVSEHLTDAVGRIGEKITISKFATVSGEEVASYIHLGAKVGVLVAFAGVDGVSDVPAIGKDVSMQIASMQPVAVEKEQIDPELVARELEIAKELARNEGKPEAMLEKIAAGRINKFYQEKALVEQEFVKDSSMTVGKYLKSRGANLKVLSFERFHLG